MKMKRLLRLLLCLIMVCSCALAETADTLPKKFNRQLTGGNGVRGYMSITASGVADWLNMLLPFTATDIQIRAIGEKQGEMSESILDDDDWQVRFYAKDSNANEVGTTWLYGDPSGVYFQSELLPDTVLTVPVENVNLLYQLMRGDYTELFFAFDPLAMKENGAQGNEPAYEAVANVMGISAEEWESKWLPVLEKYYLHLDLWLAGYGAPLTMSGESGTLTMSASYRIPAEDLKAQAKYVIGQMLYDYDLQNLLLPYVTMEQRVTYLNPSMVYFYEACIDALPLEGDIILSREMSARGETVSTTISLPIPELPEKVTTPLNAAAAAIFGLDEKQLMADMNRLEIIQDGSTRTMAVSGEKYAVSIAADVSNPDETAYAYNGNIRIEPVGEGEAVAAAFSCSVGHRIWQDEKYLDHDQRTFALSIEPANEQLDESDPQKGRCVDFKPLGIEFAVDYRNNPYQSNSAVQINYDLNIKLPDASVQAMAVLRITTQMKMEALTTLGAERISDMSDERKEALMNAFVSNASILMQNLAVVPAEEENTTLPDAEATAVPPMTE